MGESGSLGFYAIFGAFQGIGEETPRAKGNYQDPMKTIQVNQPSLTLGAALLAVSVLDP